MFLASRPGSARAQLTVKRPRPFSSVRNCSDTSPSKYMVLLRFGTQAAADEFYANYNFKPFSALEVCVSSLVVECCQNFAPRATVTGE